MWPTQLMEPLALLVLRQRHQQGLRLLLAWLHHHITLTQVKHHTIRHPLLHRLTVLTAKAVLLVLLLLPMANVHLATTIVIVHLLITNTEVMVATVVTEAMAVTVVEVGMPRHHLVTKKKTSTLHRT